MTQVFLSRFYKFFFLVVNIYLLVGCNGMGGQALVFNNADQKLEVIDIETGDQEASYRVENAIRNPLIIQGQGRIISLTEPFGESEHIINLDTGYVTYSSNTVGTIVISEDSKFYFEIVDSEHKQLYFESSEGKKKLSLVRSLKVPSGHVVGSEFVSWFIRSEHRLIVYDVKGNLFTYVPLNCRDAIFLGEEDKIFCLTESGEASMFDKSGSLLEVVSGIGVEDGILSLSYDKSQIYLRRVSLALNMERFMREVVDVYTYSTKENKLSLVGESVVSHGIGFNILVDNQRGHNQRGQAH